VIIASAFWGIIYLFSMLGVGMFFYLYFPGSILPYLFQIVGYIILGAVFLKSQESVKPQPFYPPYIPSKPSPKVKFCYKCGMEVDSLEKFCPYCGWEILNV
jgi:hypothetical protein